MEPLANALRETLERIEPTSGAYERTLHRVHRRRRRRYGAAGGALAGVLAAVLAVTLFAGSRSASAYVDIRLPGRFLNTGQSNRFFDTPRKGDVAWAVTCTRRCGDDGRHSVGRLLKLREGQIVSTTTLPDPSSVAVGVGAVWVADFWNSTVTRVDPDTGKVIATIPLKLPEPIRFQCNPDGSSCAGVNDDFLPFDVAAGEGAVWVSTERGYVAQIDPNTNRVSTYIRVEAVNGPCPNSPTPADVHCGPLGVGSIIAGNGAVWAAVDLAGVARIDPATGTVTLIAIPGKDITVPGKEGWLFAAGDSLALNGNTLSVIGEWAKPTATTPGVPDYMLTGEDAVAAIDTDTGTVGSIAPVPPDTSVMASAGGTLWLSGQNASTVYRFDSQTKIVVGKVDVHGQGTLAGAAGHALWVAIPDNILRRVAVG
jgi:streptogramin lyase